MGSGIWRGLVVEKRDFVAGQHDFYSSRNNASRFVVSSYS
jgi:hypothetical protein